MLPYTIEVQQGIIEVTQVYPRALGPSHAVFDVECKQKYPEIISYEEGRLLLGASERTLYVDVAGNLKPTEVSIHLTAGDWSMVCTEGRYCVTLMYVLIPKTGSRQEWTVKAAPRWDAVLGFR